MNSIWFLVPLLGILPSGLSQTENRTLLVVLGAEGNAEYGRQFSVWSKRWEEIAKNNAIAFRIIGATKVGSKPDRERLQSILVELAASKPDEFWLVLIGHGTFDGRQARFNLRGPDFTPRELSIWLKPIECPTAIVTCSSSSAPFLQQLSAPNRAIVTATKSGYEQNFSRFGDYFSQAIGDTTTDLDKDGQTSLLEAWLKASRKTQQFYKSRGRLPTEHALLDDNGDSLGTRSDWFRGVRVIQKTENGEADGLKANQFHLVRSAAEKRLPPAQRKRRNELELQITRLRKRKNEMDSEDYYKELEPLLVKLANLYQKTL